MPERYQVPLPPDSQAPDYPYEQDCAADPPPPATAKCRFCHQPIQWAITRNSKRMPVDVDPNPAGNVMVEPTEDGKGLFATVLGSGDRLFLPDGADVRSSHFETCPNYTRPKAKGARS